MKIINGFTIFCITIFVTSCFDPPEFPTVPEISFKDIEFYDNDNSVKDSLVLYIDFKDGDGDLGLSQMQNDSPYHAVNYFLENGSGELIPVATEVRHPHLPPIIKRNSAQNGKLVTLKTRKKPEYSNLPAYTHPYYCTSYQVDSIYVSAEDSVIFDETYNIAKYLDKESPPVFVLLDTFYYEVNPNYYNIEVDFFVKEGQEFREFDWRKELCISSNQASLGYDQRFPVLSETSTGLDGTLRYAMGSRGLDILFSLKTLKLKVQIKDRALNLSNVVETPEFTLDKIRK